MGKEDQEGAKGQEGAGGEGAGEGAKGTDVGAEVKSLGERIDKIIHTLEEKSKQEAFDPAKLLKELEQVSGEGEGEKTSRQEGTPDFGNMRPEEFAQFMVNQSRKDMENLVRPLAERLESLRVRLEVADCRGKYSDFNDHRDDIFKLAMSNPNLSLEDAYLQVTGKKSVETRRTEAQKKEQEEKERKAREEEKKQAGSERPAFFGGERGPISKRASTETPTTLKDATILAIKEVMGTE